MSMFSWLWGGSKRAKEARSERRGLKIYQPPAESPSRNRTRTGTGTQTQSGSGDFAGDYLDTSMGESRWVHLVSSNVDRIRYDEETRQLQVIFHAHPPQPARGYRYWNVEPNIFESFCRTHSPGQFVWYVLRAYGYPYKEMTGPFTESSAPASSRYDEMPFAVSADIEATQKRAGRKPQEGGLWNFGAPTAKPYKGSPTGAKQTPLS
jgi:hypothetical protein